MLRFTLWTGHKLEEIIKLKTTFMINSNSISLVFHSQWTYTLLFAVGKQSIRINLFILKHVLNWVYRSYDGIPNWKVEVESIKEVVAQPGNLRSSTSRISCGVAMTLSISLVFCGTHKALHVSIVNVEITSARIIKIMRYLRTLWLLSGAVYCISQG